MKNKKIFLQFFQVISFINLITYSGTMLFSKSSELDKSDLKVASLSEKYKQQEENKYYWYNKCVEIYNEGNYADLQEISTGQQKEIKRYKVISKDGKDYVLRVRPSIVAMRDERSRNIVRRKKTFPEVCYEDSYPGENANFYIGEIYGSSGGYDNFQYQYEWESVKKDKLIYYASENGRVDRRTFMVRCPAKLEAKFLDNDRKRRKYSYKFNGIYCKNLRQVSTDDEYFNYGHGY